NSLLMSFNKAPINHYLHFPTANINYFTKKSCFLFPMTNPKHKTFSFRLSRVRDAVTSLFTPRQPRNSLSTTVERHNTGLQPPELSSHILKTKSWHGVDSSKSVDKKKPNLSIGKKPNLSIDTSQRRKSW